MLQINFQKIKKIVETLYKKGFTIVQKIVKFAKEQLKRIG